MNIIKLSEVGSKGLVPVVLLDIRFAGYGAGRSLAPYDIPLIGVKPEGFMPEKFSRYFQEIVEYRSIEGPLAQLEYIAHKYPEKPVLMLNTDLYVKFALKHRDFIEAKFRIELPDSHTTDMLLDKTMFASFASKNGYSVPHTLAFSKEEEIEVIRNNFQFPIILKPYLKSDSWENSEFVQSLPLCKF